MHLGQSCSQSLSQSHAYRQMHAMRLTHEQSICLQQILFSATTQLVGSLRGEKYEPKARCPGCGRELTPVEIVAGFNRDPNDFTTACSGCSHRFAPRLICFQRGATIELPFFCSDQALHQMRGLSASTPEELARVHPAIYRSAIIHHGSIRQAFAKIGVEYPHTDVEDWQNKIKPFLGRLPDTVIAKCVDESVQTIRSLRHRLDVPRFNARKVLASEKK